MMHFKLNPEHTMTICAVRRGACDWLSPPSGRPLQSEQGSNLNTTIEYGWEKGIMAVY
jgi:hypothetical protein